MGIDGSSFHRKLTDVEISVLTSPGIVLYGQCVRIMEGKASYLVGLSCITSGTASRLISLGVPTDS